VLLGGPFFPGSVGASGAVSGLMGLAWVATRKPSSDERGANPLMTRWILLLLLWGLVPGIDGAAHFAGLLVGGGLGWRLSEGPPASRLGHRGWTAAALLSMAAVLGSSALTLAHASGQPFQLEDDLYPRRMLFFTLEAGTPWPESGQRSALRTCLNRSEAAGAAPPSAIDACELAIRAVPASPAAHRALGHLLVASGKSSRGARQLAIARRLERR
jgi:hypothetical protein